MLIIVLFSAKYHVGIENEEKIEKKSFLKKWPAHNRENRRNLFICHDIFHKHQFSSFNNTENFKFWTLYVVF